MICIVLINVKMPTIVGILTFTHRTKTTTEYTVQSVTCLTADPGVANPIPARSHTFVVIVHEIISTAR